MTYGLVLIKGNSGKRDTTLKYLENLKDNKTFIKKFGTVTEVFISFGWPDFIIIIKSINIECLKSGIVELREKLEKTGDNIETSTIVCSTKNDIEEVTKKIGESIQKQSL